MKIRTVRRGKECEYVGVAQSTDFVCHVLMLCLLVAVVAAPFVCLCCR